MMTASQKNTGKYLSETPKKTKRRKKSKAVPLLITMICIMLAVLSGMLYFIHNQSIYQSIVRAGYTGTQEQWLASFVGEEVGQGGAESAYELAVANGYTGTEAEWIETIIGVPVTEIKASPYALACENGFEGSLAEWLSEIADKPEKLGLSDGKGQKTEYELACEYGYSGTFIEWIVSVANDRVFE